MEFFLLGLDLLAKASKVTQGSCNPSLLQNLLETVFTIKVICRDFHCQFYACECP